MPTQLERDLLDAIRAFSFKAAVGAMSAEEATRNLLLHASVSRHNTTAGLIIAGLPSKDYMEAFNKAAQFAFISKMKINAANRPVFYVTEADAKKFISKFHSSAPHQSPPSGNNATTNPIPKTHAISTSTVSTAQERCRAQPSAQPIFKNSTTTFPLPKIGLKNQPEAFQKKMGTLHEIHDLLSAPNLMNKGAYFTILFFTPRGKTPKHLQEIAAIFKNYDIKNKFIDAAELRTEADDATLTNCLDEIQGTLTDALDNSSAIMRSILRATCVQDAYKKARDSLNCVLNPEPILTLASDLDNKPIALRNAEYECHQQAHDITDHRPTLRQRRDSLGSSC